MSYSAINAFDREPLDKSYWFQEGPGVRTWQFTTSGIKLLNVGNITTTGSLDLAKTSIHLSHDEVSRTYKHFLLDAGDLVIASSGISFDTDGLLRTKMAFVSQKELPLCLNTSTIRFKSKDSERSSIQFLRYWFDSQDFRLQITRLVTGSAQQNFGPSHLKQLTIPLPTLPEQKRIAAILDKADRLRRQRRFAQTLSDSFLQSVFIKMFGDPAANPLEFDVLELGDFIQSFQGGVNFDPVAETNASPWRILKISAVTWGEFNAKESKPISRDEKFDETLIVKKGDLLISRANTTELVGAVCMVREKPPMVLLPDKLWRIKFSKDSQLNPEYALNLLRQKHLRQIIGVLATGSSGSMKNISKEKAATLPIMLPPLPLQEKFAAIVQKFERIRRQQREATRQAEHLFQTLLHRAFRGEL